MCLLVFNLSMDRFVRNPRELHVLWVFKTLKIWSNYTDFITKHSRTSMDPNLAPWPFLSLSVSRRKKEREIQTANYWIRIWNSSSWRCLDLCWFWNTYLWYLSMFVFRGLYMCVYMGEDIYMSLSVYTYPPPIYTHKYRPLNTNKHTSVCAHIQYK